MEATLLKKTKVVTKHNPGTANFPSLRFKEFEGKWNIMPLEGNLDIITGFAFKGEEISEDPTGVPLLRGINITEGRIRHTPEIDRYYLGSTEKLAKLVIQEGDVVLGMDGSKVGKNVAIITPYDEGAILIQRVARLRSNNRANLKFIYHHINSIKFHSYVDVVNTSSGIPHISLQQINAFKIGFPTLPEQEKIATFLSAVDEKIQQLTRKKALLQEYKKGVMQQLFSGQLRFKDENGKDFPKWEEKRLGEVSKIYDGTHQTPVYVKDGIPFYSVEHVTANQFTSTKYISRSVFEKENEKVRLEKGDILMTKIGDIGTSRLIDWDVEASFYVSLALIKKNDNIKSEFLNQFIGSRNFQLELWKRIIHVAFPKKINLGEIGYCKILIPTLNEQIKIASYLDCLDQNTERINLQISQTQTFKKGLLQQMFV